jgi:hypothetical protein
MKPKWIIGIVIGILLAYIGAFGTAGFGFQTGTTLPYHEEFNDLNQWNTSVGGTLSGYALESGTLKTWADTKTAGGLAGVYQTGGIAPALGVATVWTARIRMKVDVWGGSSSQGNLQGHEYWRFVTASGTKLVDIYLMQTMISYPGDLGTWMQHATDTNYHLYTIVYQAGAYDFYIDNLKLVSAQAASVTTNNEVRLYTKFANQAHYDYLYLDNEAIPPINPPVDQYGSLVVQAFSDSTPIQINVIATGPETRTGITTTSGSPLTFTNVKVGTYYVTGTYNSVTKSVSATVVANQQASAVLTWTSNPQPTTGALIIQAYSDNNPIAVPVTVTGPESHSGTTTTSGNPLTFTVTFGTYTVTGSYNGVQKTATATVSSTGSGVATLSWTSVVPPTDFLQMIRNFINNGTTRTVLLWGGIACSGLSAIVAFVPFSKKFRYPSMA